MFEIKAKKRELTDNLDVLRKEGFIPAVFYGAGEKNTSISINTNEFKKVWRDAGESTAIKISLEGKNLDALIQDVGANPVTGEPVHVDFLIIDAKKEVEVSVPLEFTGIAPAVKSNLGVLVKVMHEIEVSALPKDLPQVLEVDISSLVDLDSVITVKDIKTPANVKITTKAEEIVASVAPMQEEKEDSGPIDLSSIEVEKKGKKEEESVEN